MIKRICVCVLALALFISSSMTAFACDEDQTNVYVIQILFGDDAFAYELDEDVEKLLSALYICSEQSNGSGKEELKVLRNAKVGSIPTVSKINVDSTNLSECSHNSWEYVSKDFKKAQNSRKDVLRKTVVKVFDFGVFTELFKSNSGQIDSFAALLYYSHILADYLAVNPTNTEVSAKGYDISAYSGEAVIELHGNVPEFTLKQKQETMSYKEFSDLDEYGRAGVAIANVGPDILAPAGSREKISNIKPTGWKQENYDGMVNQTLYNRCHLIAHQLTNVDTRYNLVTGTEYMNTAMISYENKVKDYVNETGNHVLYRVTPVYVGDNEVAHGVQIEAYSIEDQGDGICFNVYCYNVQPGIDINYANGNSELADSTYGVNDILPFVTANPNDNNPDLIYEINKHLEILFAEQKESSTYKTMMNDLNVIANEARSVGNQGEKEFQRYQKLKECQYDYVEKLSEYVPKLLAQENFFKSVFE